MKVIIAGSTGLLGTRLIYDALSNPKITSLIGLSRRETILPEPLPPNADISKFKSVVLTDFMEYSDDVKGELEGVRLVIWTIAIVPLKHNTISTFAEIRKISLDFATKGLATISNLPPSSEHLQQPLRFIYLSSSGSVRAAEGGKKPFVLGEYCLMRGEAETNILSYAKSPKSKGRVQACIARPGVITDRENDGLSKLLRARVAGVVGIPTVELKEVAAALLEIGLSDGEEFGKKETVENEELVRVGREVLGRG